MNIKPMAPNISAHRKTHKINEPKRPVIINIHAPSYKIKNYLNKKTKSLVCLPNTYTTKNSYEIAQELKNIQINENNKMITLRHENELLANTIHADILQMQSTDSRATVH